MEWNKKFNTIIEKELEINEFNSWKFSLQENKSKGTLNINIREFIKARVLGGYEGPTKNGFLLNIESKEQIEELQKFYNDFFNEVLKSL